MEGLLTEIVGSAIDRAFGFTIGQVAESTTWKEWKFKNRLSVERNNFLDIYIEAIVEYTEQEKHSCLKDFFRQETVINTLEAHWYGGKTDLPFYESLKHLAHHFTLPEQLGDESLAIAEVNLFEKKFRKAGNDSASVPQREAFDKLVRIEEKVDQLQPQEIRTPKELTLLNHISPDDIIGRKDDLEDLRNQLAEKHRIVLLNGMGGIGKTTLAEAYISKNYKNYKHIAWITNNLSLIHI